VPADEHGDELALLRQEPDNPHFLGGFGPLVVGAVLFVLMVLLAPTIAPERVVEEPVGGTTTTTFEVGATTTTTTPTSTSATEPAPTSTVAP
jgi:hypothetical protein